MQLRLDSLPLRTENNILRRMKPADMPQFQAYRSDPDLARYQGWSIMSFEAARTFILNMAEVQALEPGGWIQLAIADASTDALLGDMGLFVDEAQAEAEIGFTLGRNGQGSGHAARAVRTASKQASSKAKSALNSFACGPEATPETGLRSPFSGPFSGGIDAHQAGIAL